MLKYLIIDKNNYEIAVKIQNTIFPEYDASTNYYQSFNDVTDNVYYLVYDTIKKTYIGITGIYRLSIDLTTAWLGWFGVLEEYRRCGYGKLMIQNFIDNAKKLGCKYCRIYTDKFDNDIAINFYKACGFSFEEYINEMDPASIDYPIVIGSKSLCDSNLQLWNNKMINLTNQVFVQNKFKIRLLSLDNLRDVLTMYKKCFMNNSYFLNYFKGKDLNAIMDSSFNEMFKYCIDCNLSFCCLDNDKIIGFVLCFDYFETKKRDIRMLNNIFTSDYDNFNYPYITEIHNEIYKMKKPILYLLALAVDDCFRNKKICTQLVNYIILNYSTYTIVSDVTNPFLKSALVKKGFCVKKINDDYFLLYKEHQ